MAEAKRNRTFDAAARLTPAAVRKLAAIAGADGIESLRWSNRDLPEIWQHQLNASIVTELAEIDAVDALTVNEILRARGVPAAATFRQLIQQPHPDARLLARAMRVATKQMSDPDPVVPPVVGLALHVVLLLAMRLRCTDAITCRSSPGAIADAELRRRANWLLRQGWTDDSAKTIAAEALTKLDVSDHPI